MYNMETFCHTTAYAAYSAFVENEDEEVAVPAIPVISKGAWDDEDVEDDEVKASWEDSDEEEKKPEEAKPASNAPIKKKKGLAQKLAERREEEERKKAELAAKKVGY